MQVVDVEVSYGISEARIAKRWLQEYTAATAGSRQLVAVGGCPAITPAEYSTDLVRIPTESDCGDDRA